MAWKVCSSFYHHSRALPTSFLLPESLAFIDLGGCNNIRKVRLYNILLVNSAHAIDAFGTRWASKLISQMSSPHVEEIIFSFSAPIRNIRSFDWQSVGNALGSLKQLRRFHVELCEANPGNTRDDLLQKLFENAVLHDLASRGMLEVIYM